MTASSLSGDARHTHNLNNGRTPSIRLNVVVVGCGLGGLACAFSLHKAGHNVVILETARNIGEVQISSFPYITLTEGKYALY
jgi:salicylate hydroxylase